MALIIGTVVSWSTILYLWVLDRDSIVHFSNPSVRLPAKTLSKPQTHQKYPETLSRHIPSESPDPEAYRSWTLRAGPVTSAAEAFWFRAWDLKPGETLKPDRKSEKPTVFGLKV